MRLNNISISNNDFFHVKKIHIIASGSTEISNLDWDVGDQIYEDPMFIKKGEAWDGWYKLNGNSLLIDAGVDVGLPYLGKAPDIGAEETK